MAESLYKTPNQNPTTRLKTALPPDSEGEGFKKQPTMTDLAEKKKNDPVLSKLRFMERGDLLRVVNGTYIAERFFGKSGCWFSQKLNGHVKNGKPCEFTPEELKTLSDALYTISIELQELADELQ